MNLIFIRMIKKNVNGCFVSVTSISEVKASNLTPTTPQVAQIPPRLSRQESLRPNNQALPLIKQINEDVCIIFAFLKYPKYHNIQKTTDLAI